MDELRDVVWSDDERLAIVQSAWHILLKRDRVLMRRVLSILKRWYDQDDLKSELFLRGWLVVDYARGSRSDCANYVYSVMVNRLRDIARALKRRYDHGFSDEDSLDRLDVGVDVSGDYIEWLQGRELDVMRLRVGLLERLLREHAEGAYWDYRMRVDGLVDDVLAADSYSGRDTFTVMDREDWSEVEAFLDTVVIDDEDTDWGSE